MSETALPAAMTLARSRHRRLLWLGVAVLEPLPCCEVSYGHTSWVPR